MKMKLLVVGLFLGISLQAQAHDWYPWNCCSDQDCAVVQNKVDAPGGTWITTAKGTAFFPLGFEIKPSQDGNEHACMGPKTEGGVTKMRPICWFQPGTA